MLALNYTDAMIKIWLDIALWKRILGAMMLGIGLGLLMQGASVALQPIGALFLRAIEMLIVPLLFFSLVSGMSTMADPKQMGRVGMRAFGLYVFTTFLAITLGLSLSALLQPGVGVEIAATKVELPVHSGHWSDALVNLVPTNPIAAFAEGNVLQIIVFSLLLGIAITLAGDEGAQVAQFCHAGAAVMYRMTRIVMELAPFGVFALMAVVAGSHGLDVLLPLLQMVAVFYLACLVHAGLVLPAILHFAGRMHARYFFSGIADAQAVAFSTASSAGTLPVSMTCARENLGVSRPVASFVLPLGATINMDGTAIYQGIAAIFLAQAYGVDLNLGHYVIIILTSTLASIGSAGIPGAGLIMLSLVLQSVGLPLEGIAIIAGVDRIMDMARTAVNVTGDLMVSVLVARQEGELDEELFYQEPQV